MSHASTLRPKHEIEYPEDDGNPLAESTIQYEWITTIKGGLDGVFADDPNVFVAGDLLWYPVEGDPTTRRAPDTMVVFGRPKQGRRGSYLQWLEGNIAPQVVFEVLSPSNRGPELALKFAFYERFGVEEYYIYDPDPPLALKGYRREGDALRPIAVMNGWVSPRLGVRFELAADGLRLIGPDGRPFVSFAELLLQRAEAEHQRDEAARQRDEAARQRDEAARQRDEVERQRDEVERQRDEVERQRNEAARQRDEALGQREAERQRAERLAERLRALGIDPEA